MIQPDEIFEAFRRRVPMYTGENTLASINLFLSGYGFALTQHEVSGVGDPFFIPYEFHAWVAYRLHLSESTSGWCSMIRMWTNSEQEAINRFFELLSEFRNRKSHLVARLTGFRKVYTQCTIEQCDGQNIQGPTVTLTYPDSISLVTYTDDPGFFAYSDTSDPLPGEGFFPDLESFEIGIGADRSQLTVIDHKWALTNQ